MRTRAHEDNTRPPSLHLLKVLCCQYAVNTLWVFERVLNFLFFCFFFFYFFCFFIFFFLFFCLSFLFSSSFFSITALISVIFFNNFLKTSIKTAISLYFSVLNFFLPFHVFYFFLNLHNYFFLLLFGRHTFCKVNFRPSKNTPTSVVCVRITLVFVFFIMCQIPSSCLSIFFKFFFWLFLCFVTMFFFVFFCFFVFFWGIFSRRSDLLKFCSVLRLSIVFFAPKSHFFQLAFLHLSRNKLNP